MAEKIFPKGLRIFNKHPKAPDFVKGDIVISINELVEFCKSNPDYLTEYKGDKQLKLQLQEGRNGLMAVVNTYKKEDLPF